jgi:Tol biopolymer transport system component
LRRARLRRRTRSSDPRAQKAGAQFSPDGRWVAYQSDESGRNEIYVASFTGSGGKRLISADGGFLERWRPDGKEIFYVGPNGKLMAAEVSTKEASIEVVAIRSLGVPGNSYEVSANGQRFLAAVPQQQDASAPLMLVENWTAQLKKK